MFLIMRLHDEGILFHSHMVGIAISWHVWFVCIALTQKKSHCAGIAETNQYAPLASHTYLDTFSMGKQDEGISPLQNNKSDHNRRHMLLPMSSSPCLAAGSAPNIASAPRRARSVSDHGAAVRPNKSDTTVTVLSRFIQQQKYRDANKRLSSAQSKEASMWFPVNKRAQQRTKRSPDPPDSSAPLSSQRHDVLHVLPIHLACQHLCMVHEASRRRDLERLIVRLVRVYPDGCRLRPWRDHSEKDDTIRQPGASTNPPSPCWLPIQQAVLYHASPEIVSFLLVAAPETLLAQACGTKKEGKNEPLGLIDLLRFRRDQPSQAINSDKQSHDKRTQQLIQNMLKQPLTFWQRASGEAKLLLKHRTVHRHHVPQSPLSKESSSSSCGGSDAASILSTSVLASSSCGENESLDGSVRSIQQKDLDNYAAGKSDQQPSFDATPKDSLRKEGPVTCERSISATPQRRCDPAVPAEILLPASNRQLRKDQETNVSIHIKQALALNQNLNQKLLEAMTDLRQAEAPTLHSSLATTPPVTESCIPAPASRTTGSNSPNDELAQLRYANRTLQLQVAALAMKQQDNHQMIVSSLTRANTPVPEPGPHHLRTVARSLSLSSVTDIQDTTLGIATSEEESLRADNARQYTDDQVLLDVERMFGYKISDQVANAWKLTSVQLDNQLALPGTDSNHGQQYADELGFATLFKRAALTYGLSFEEGRLDC